jgi:hypothetical protein
MYPVFAGMSMVHAHAQILVPFTHGSRSTPMKPKRKEKGWHSRQKIILNITYYFYPSLRITLTPEIRYR